MAAQWPVLCASGGRAWTSSSRQGQRGSSRRAARRPTWWQKSGAAATRPAAPGPWLHNSPPQSAWMARCGGWQVGRATSSHASMRSGPACRCNAAMIRSCASTAAWQPAASCMLLPCHHHRHLAHRLAHLHAQHVRLAQQAGVRGSGGGAQQPGAGQQPRPLFQQAPHCACQVLVACLVCQARRGCDSKALGQDEPCAGGLQACAAVRGGGEVQLTGRRGAADRGCTERAQLRCRVQTVVLYHMVGSSRRCCRCHPSWELPTRSE